MLHPTAIIHPKAEIGSDCEIGPYCVIGPNVVLGPNCRLHSHVVLDGHTILGKGNEIYPFATVGMKTQDLKWVGGTTHLKMGDYNTVREYVSIHCATEDGGTTVVGSHNNILANCHVAHDVTLGDHIIMSNLATLGGHVVVEDNAVVGGMVAVHQFCRIGKMSIVGALSKVVQDIPPFMMADGSPAETRTINKVGLERNGVAEAAQKALRQTYKILFREGLIVKNALLRVEAAFGSIPEIQHLLHFIRQSKRGIK